MMNEASTHGWSLVIWEWGPQANAHGRWAPNKATATNASRSPHSPRTIVHSSTRQWDVKVANSPSHHQSDPSAFPSNGLQAFTQVVTLIEPLTLRTLPSPSAVCIAPGWAPWVT